MKNLFLTLAVTLFIAGAIFTGCKSSSKKSENGEDKISEAKDKVVEANQDLNKAIKDSIQQYKIAAQEQIDKYEKSIAELKLKIVNEKKEDKAKYDKKLAELEQQNKNLKKKLLDYKDEENDKWIAFRDKFNNDLANLGKALKDFTVKSK